MPTIRVWVDADACPGPIKEIIFRAAQQRCIETTLVANHFVRVPKSPFIRSIQVASGFDMADARIVQGIRAGDLVVTGDIPLAAQVVKAHAVALNPRGTLYTEDSIHEHLSRRNFMEEMRSTGMLSGGPAGLDKTHLQAFANQFDKYLTQALRGG